MMYRALEGVRAALRRSKRDQLHAHQDAAFRGRHGPMTSAWRGAHAIKIVCTVAEL
jgi:hypothetical protein